VNMEKGFLVLEVPNQSVTPDGFWEACHNLNERRYLRRKNYISRALPAASC